MILLDTNVISELMKPRPNSAVEAWLESKQPADCFLSTITEAELRYGIELLPPGQKRKQFQIALSEMIEQDFAGRVLPFDSAGLRAKRIFVCHADALLYGCTLRVAAKLGGGLERVMAHAFRHSSFGFRH